MIIYKYKLDFFKSKTVLNLPINARVVHADHQLSTPTIWVLLDNNELKKKERSFVVVATGVELPKNAQHLGTYSDGPYVWHIMELGS